MYTPNTPATLNPRKPQKRDRKSITRIRRAIQAWNDRCTRRNAQ